MNPRYILVLLGAALVLSGCRTVRPGAGDQDVSGAEPGPVDAMAGESTEDAIAAALEQALAEVEAKALDENPIPQVRAGLVMDVEVYVQGLPEIQEKGKRVAPSGQLTLPLVGAVKAAGFTLEELAEQLTNAYRKYLLEPQVIVSYSVEDQWITASPWGFVTVMGRVNKPGRVPLPPTRDLTVSVAIQMASGFNTSADTNDIIVSRMLPDGSREKKKVSLSDLAKKGHFEEDIVLYDRDVVYVPEHLF